AVRRLSLAKTHGSALAAASGSSPNSLVLPFSAWDRRVRRDQGPVLARTLVPSCASLCREAQRGRSPSSRRLCYTARATLGPPRARSASAAGRQVLAEAVEYEVGSLFALLDLIDVVKERALLGVGELRPVTVRNDLDRGKRDGRPRVARVHLVAV